MTIAGENFEKVDVREIRSAMGFSPEIIGVVLDTAVKTIYRWEKNGIPATTSVRTLEDVHKLKAIKELGQLVYGENFGQFLRTPMRALGGKSPQRALTGGDIDRVYELLVRAYEGVGF